MLGRPSLLGIVWLVVGLIVAANNGYLGGIGDLSDLLSALLAIVLWPLVLLGVDLGLNDENALGALASLGTRV
jgi:hypothetical protein